MTQRAGAVGKSRPRGARRSGIARLPDPPPARRTGSADHAGLTPGAVRLLNALADIGVGGADPWRDYPPILDIQHVAKALGMSAPAASEAARRGSIPMVKVCGRWRIDQVEFRRFCGYRDAPDSRGGR